MDDHEPTRTPTYKLGQDLSDFSVAELAQAKVNLQAEIERIEADIVQKLKTANAAASLFKT